MRVISLIVLSILAAPLAAAEDPFRDELCIDQQTCSGPGACTPVACVPRSCQPLAYCWGVLTSTQECALNATIDGQTCQLIAGIGVRANGPEHDAWVAASLTDGNVDAFNLPNTWITPAVDTSATLFGIHTGDISVGVYKSEIFTEGPRGGPLGGLSPSPDHQWTHLAVALHHGQGATTGNDIVVGIYLLDLVPEACYARSSASTVPIFECPRAPQIL